MTFNLFGPFTGGTHACDTANNTNRVLGAFTVPVNTSTGVATTGSQSFTPTAAGTYYWVASFSGDVNNTTVNATNVGCGDAYGSGGGHSAVGADHPDRTRPARSSADGTSSTLSTFNYSGTTTITNENPGVFFYYDKVTVPAGTNTITVNESITSSNTFPSGKSNYLLRVLNDSASQVQLFDANCTSVGSATVTLGPINTVTNTYPVTITTPSNLAAGTYIFSVKYTPKTLTGLGVPSPTTIVYSFSSTLNGVLVSGSTQTISGVKS